MNLLSDGKYLNKIRLTHPEKVLFPESGVTKRDVAEYYLKIIPFLLPYLKGRPVTLIRCTKTISENCFYQKHWDESMPKFIQCACIEEKEKTSPYIVTNTPEAIMSAVQLNALEFHPWSARVDQIEKPDQLIFDLDPDSSINWKQMIAAAEELHSELKNLGLISFIKLTGGKGFHLVVPLRRDLDWRSIKTYARQFANHMQLLNPKRYVTTMNKQKRAGKIFIDYFRNSRGATAVAPYSLRSRPNASIAMPLSWEGFLKTKSPAEFTIHSNLSKSDENPWPDFFNLKQIISKQLWSKLLAD